MSNPVSPGNPAAGSGQTNVADEPLPDPVPWHQTLCLGLYFVFLAATIFYLLIASWPAMDAGKSSDFASFSLFGSDNIYMQSDQRLMLTVILSGALGSLIHGVTSFADYVGNRRLGKSWIWWLILRTPVGIALALLFYFVLRGGLVVPSLPSSAGQTNTTTLLNPYGIAAISALAGMFSKQATDKLREIFDTLFRTSEPVSRADPLDVITKPAISSTDPAKLTVGQPAELSIIGQGFDQYCTGLVDGAARRVSWESSTRLILTLLPEDVARQAVLTIVIRNPGSTGGESEAFRVIVE